MSRPSDSTLAESVQQWTSYHAKENGCPFKEKLAHHLSRYASSNSLICSADFNELSHSYKVYFSVSSTHQLTTGYLSGIEFLPIFTIDPQELKEVNCRGDKCRRSFDPSSGIWCTACHGDLDDSAYSLIDHLLKPSFKFGKIPESCILYIESTKNDGREREEQVSLIEGRIEALREKIKKGGEYDQEIEAIERKRVADTVALTELELQLEDSS